MLVFGAFALYDSETALLETFQKRQFSFKTAAAKTTYSNPEFCAPAANDGDLYDDMLGATAAVDGASVDEEGYLVADLRQSKLYDDGNSTYEDEPGQREHESNSKTFYHDAAPGSNDISI